MITIHKVIKAINSSADKVQAYSEYINDLDAIVGDGEHGINLSKAFKRVQDKMPDIRKENLGALLKGVGMELIASGGGAGTTFYGMAFLAAGKLAGDADEMDALLLHKVISAGLEDICKRGGASPGDKTMVDALSLAVEKLEESIQSGKDIHEALNAAAAAARVGAVSTKEMLGKKGRSLYSSERALGTPDPGACSAYVILCGFAGIEPELPL